jgi:hypothetical protein
MQRAVKNADAVFINVMESGVSISHCVVKRWYPNSSSGANWVAGGFDVGPRKSFMENSIIIKKNKFLSKVKQNDPENVIIECVFINFKHTRGTKI